MKPFVSSPIYLAEAYVNRGNARRANQDLPDALADHDEAIRSSPMTRKPMSIVAYYITRIKIWMMQQKITKK
jgi:hypothetical protein